MQRRGSSMTETGAGSSIQTVTSGKTQYFIVYTAIVIVTIGINIFAQPARFADLDTYVYYLDGLVHFPSKSWMYFEVFSNLYLLISYWFTQSVLSAIIFAHYILNIIFLVLLLTAFPPRRSSWPALLLMFAILGPLLTFVTMRATPAYFLIAIGVRYAIDRRASAWVFLGAAAMFHISSLLAALPMALLYFENNLPRIMRSDRSRKFYLFATVGILALGAIIPQASSGATALIQSIPVISKYDAYTAEVLTQTSIGHYLFLGFLAGFVMAFMAVSDAISSRLKIYIIASFGLYVIMFFSASPVAAFRQAPFWLMPMIAILPWEKLGLNKLTVPLFIGACVGLFVFQFQQVYF